MIYLLLDTYTLRCVFFYILMMMMRDYLRVLKGNLDGLLFYIGRKRYQVTLTSSFIFLINHFIPVYHTTSLSFASTVSERILKMRLGVQPAPFPLLGLSTLSLYTYVKTYSNIFKILYGKQIKIQRQRTYLIVHWRQPGRSTAHALI